MLIDTAPENLERVLLRFTDIINRQPANEDTYIVFSYRWKKHTHKRFVPRKSSFPLSKGVPPYLRNILFNRFYDCTGLELFFESTHYQTPIFTDN